MEKVPRVLWWLFGGLVVLTAGVLVDVISPISWAKASHTGSLQEGA